MQLSPGSWTILALALLSSLTLLVVPVAPKFGEVFWTFSVDHNVLYESVLKDWNAAHPNPHDSVTGYVIGMDALSRRLQSGFLSGTPVPDLTEIESGAISSFFSGPVDAIGFADLTDRIHQEGLDREINTASFSTWTNRGRIYGLPHDVHPVLLAYRADIVEAAGIDVRKIETWDDFVRVMSPLMKVDGHDQRYLLNVWETNSQAMEELMLQAGGGFFDANLLPVLNGESNAKVLATIVGWITGPNRICVNAPDFDAEGNHLFLQGEVLCSLMPDWLGGVWKKDLPGLRGKVKLMPLPAWGKGGCRTSVAGGTMLGIPKRAPDFERSWVFAKHLYVNRELAEKLFRTTGIISPIRTFWDDPVYDEPNEFFCGQAAGRLYIQMAPMVPLRTSSPYKPQAVTAVTDALIRLKRYADQQGIFEVPALLPQARIELAVAQASIQRQMNANAFLRTP